MNSQDQGTRRTFNFIWFAALVLIGVGIAQLASNKWLAIDTKPVTEEFSVMHTTANITIYPNPEMTVDPQTAIRQAENEIELVSKLMNRYDKDSDIARINALPTGKTAGVDPLVWKVIQESLRLNRLSDGAFDITVHPIIELYRFNNTDSAELPTQSAISAAKAKVGSDKIISERDGMKIGFKQDGMSIDLSAIAKGFSADLAMKRLHELGVKNAMVEVGGEIRLSGKVPLDEKISTQEIGSKSGTDNAFEKSDKKTDKGRNWRIGIQHPRVILEQMDNLSLTECAIATSGDYQNFFTHNSKVYSHIIDPRTGNPVQGGVVSATVIHPDSCMIADALATTFCVLGEKSTKAFIKEFAIPGNALKLEKVKVILGVLDDDGEISEVRISCDEKWASATRDKKSKTANDVNGKGKSQ